MFGEKKTYYLSPTDIPAHNNRTNVNFFSYIISRLESVKIFEKKSFIFGMIQKWSKPRIGKNNITQTMITKDR